MSSGVVIAIAIVVLIALAVVLLATTSARRDRAAAIGVLDREAAKRDNSDSGLESVVPDGAPPSSSKEIERAAVLERTGGAVAIPARAAPPATVGPVDPETYGQTRRQFLNRGVVGLMVASITGFSATLIAFLWPTVAAGFGAKITAGNVSDIEKTLLTKQPFYNPVGRFYLNAYPTDAGTLAKAKIIYSPALLTGMQAGYVALYQRCVHLGCRVPWCTSSQWFECPCHGSKYNRVGEKKGGPAPRGLDRFAVTVANGAIIVDTGKIFVGPALGVNSTGQGQDGPHCA